MRVACAPWRPAGGSLLFDGVARESPAALSISRDTDSLHYIQRDCVDVCLCSCSCFCASARSATQQTAFTYPQQLVIVGPSPRRHASYICKISNDGIYTTIEPHLATAQTAVVQTIAYIHSDRLGMPRRLRRCLRNRTSLSP
jgi:hypothetical protein